MLLEVKNLSVHYGSVMALECADFTVSENEIVTMVGPNGAGKSSALKAVSGLLGYYNGSVADGLVLFDGEDITGSSAHNLIGDGLAIVPEGRHVFATMSVRENLEMGAYSISSKSIREARLFEILELFPRLKGRLRQPAGTLSGGEQQMLVIGRSLMTKPKLLLADEPTLGLSPNFVDAIFDKFLEICEAGVSVLLVEQNARLALEIAQRGYVFAVGKIALSGCCADLAARAEVREVFLGG